MFVFMNKKQFRRRADLVKRFVEESRSEMKAVVEKKRMVFN